MKHELVGGGQVSGRTDSPALHEQQHISTTRQKPAREEVRPSVGSPNYIDTPVRPPHNNYAATAVSSGATPEHASGAHHVGPSTPLDGSSDSPASSSVLYRHRYEPQQHRRQHLAHPSFRQAGQVPVYITTGATSGAAAGAPHSTFSINGSPQGSYDCANYTYNMAAMSHALNGMNHPNPYWQGSSHAQLQGGYVYPSMPYNQGPMTGYDYYSQYPQMQYIPTTSLPPQTMQSSMPLGVSFNDTMYRQEEIVPPSIANGRLLHGPPKKPRQSGHALWVGNLPSTVKVESLKDFFALPGIESVFLISKSNCAFVNYSTAEACNEALQKFSDARLGGVRIVCRLRRQSTAEDSAGSQPSSPTNSFAENNVVLPPTRTRDRYFVVKSLTVEDLDWSVKTGVWATQKHNEELFNNAYNSADNVYLVFSANKSGEYYGYARMASPIVSSEDQKEPSDGPETSSGSHSSSSYAVLTPASDKAPRGRIVDDSVRGTIFWEMIDDDDNEDVDESNSWGTPFVIEWIGLGRVPFGRVRGLRNPLNQNREVKIARDGTEIEANVARRITSLFMHGSHWSGA